jgi:hypothetical protein
MGLGRLLLTAEAARHQLLQRGGDGCIPASHHLHPLTGSPQDLTDVHVGSQFPDVRRLVARSNRRQLDRPLLGVLRQVWFAPAGVRIRQWPVCVASRGLAVPDRDAGWRWVAPAGCGRVAGQLTPRKLVCPSVHWSPWRSRGVTAWRRLGHGGAVGSQAELRVVGEVADRGDGVVGGHGRPPGLVGRLRPPVPAGRPGLLTSLGCLPSGLRSSPALGDRCLQPPGRRPVKGGRRP